MKSITVSGAIILRTNPESQQKEIFATQRGYGDWKGWWEIPGGKLEPGETPEQCIVREIREELATEIKVEKKLGVVEYDYPDFHLIMHCILCSIESGKLELLEHEAAKWLNKDTLHSVDWLPADQLILPEIEKLLRNMILGLQLYGPIACGQASLPELFKGIKEIGIERVEPCISLDGKSENPSFWSMEKCREVFPLLKEIGLDCISCHVTSEDLGSKLSLDAMCQLVDDYGIRHIIMGTPALDEPGLKKAASLYCKIADVLSVYNARLLVHNGKPDIAAKVQGRTAYEYLVDACLGKVGMQFDIGWAARGGEDPYEIIKRNAQRIESFHFKDFDLRNDTDVDVCIGDGTLNNELFMQFGLSTGIPLFIDADTYPSLFEDVKKSYGYLMSIAQ